MYNVYCISVWGGVPESSFETAVINYLFRLNKGYTSLHMFSYTLNPSLKANFVVKYFLVFEMRQIEAP